MRRLLNTHTVAHTVGHTVAQTLVAVTLAFTIFGCAGDEPKITATFNQSAALMGDLPRNPLQRRVITSGATSTDETMYTLFGNEIAVDYARSSAQPPYPSGSMLSLVTWTQREDARWYGGEIPDQVKSVEYVSVEVAPDGQTWYSYQKYVGTPLTQVAPSERAATPGDRAAEILALRAAVMP